MLLHEAVDALNLANAPAGVLIDGTFGRGGHSRLILSNARPSTHSLVAFDKDEAAREAAQALSATARASGTAFTWMHRSFATAGTALRAHGTTSIAGALLDLGVSSPQIDEAVRGFSFRRDGPLDMRMDQSQGQTAADFLHTATLDQLIHVLRDYGEERYAVPLAKALIARRTDADGTNRPWAGTDELAAFVASTLRRCGAPREPGQDPATRTFQALRIHINQELTQLESGLDALFGLLAPGARLVVIAFHSLEDRIVKQFMRTQSSVPQPPKGLPIRADQLPQPAGRLIGKAQRPSAAEIAANPRSRSAILRIIEKNLIQPAPCSA